MSLHEIFEDMGGDAESLLELEEYVNIVNNDVFDLELEEIRDELNVD